MPYGNLGAWRNKHKPGWRPYFTAPGLNKNSNRYTIQDRRNKKNNALTKHGGESGSDTTNNVKWKASGKGDVFMARLTKLPQHLLIPQPIDIFVAPGLTKEASLRKERLSKMKQNEPDLLRNRTFRPTQNAATELDKATNTGQNPRTATALPNSINHPRDRGGEMINATQTQIDASGNRHIIVGGEIEVPSSLLKSANKSRGTFRHEDTRNRNTIAINNGNNGGIPELANNQGMKAGGSGEGQVEMPSTFPKVSEKPGFTSNVNANSLKYYPREGTRFQNVQVCK